MGYNTWKLQITQGQEMRWQISPTGNSAYGQWGISVLMTPVGTEALKDSEQMAITLPGSSV